MIHLTEIIWSEIQVKRRKPLITGSFYRSKEDTQGYRIDELSSSITNLSSKINTHQVMVNGDFNIQY